MKAPLSVILLAACATPPPPGELLFVRGGIIAPVQTTGQPLSEGRTLVALFPRTGRTHQLRVHAAHPLGLAAPIAGERLYGKAGERLLLPAAALAFVHPRTAPRLGLDRAAPV